MHLLLPLLLAAAATHTVEAGPLRLKVVLAEAPQVFHVVDQLSGWNAFRHKSYRRYFSATEHGGLSADEEKLLAAHAELRKRRGYGPIDVALSADESLEAALDGAEKSGALDAHDAATERAVLTHFRVRALALSKLQQPALEAFARGIDASTLELRRYATLASRFFGGNQVEATVVLVPAAQGGSGGGYAQGMLVIEVNGESSPTYVLEHELWHAFAAPHDDALHAAAKEVGTDFETLSEGLAYAVAPGIFRPPDGADALARQVSKDAAEHKPFFEQPYVRFNRLGLALRPTLEPALHGAGTFESYLPTEKAIYLGLAEVALAEERPTPRFFLFGPADPALAKAIAAREFDTWSRPLKDQALQELRPKIRPHDVVVLLLATADALPPEFAELLGDRASELTQHRSAATGGELLIPGAHGEEVVALWAPAASDASARARHALKVLGDPPASTDGGR